MTVCLKRAGKLSCTTLRRVEHEHHSIEHERELNKSNVVISEKCQFENQPLGSSINSCRRAASGGENLLGQVLSINPISSISIK